MAKTTWILLLGILQGAAWGCSASEEERAADTGQDSATSAGTDSATADPQETDSGSGEQPQGTDILPGDCEKGEVACLEELAAECNAQGDAWTVLEDCAATGLRCAAGACRDVSEACAKAMNERSYIGCEYMAVTLANSSLDLESFGFAVAVANDGDVDATVTVTDGAQINRDYELPAGEMIVIEDLPWKPALVAPGKKLTAEWASRKVLHGAYRVTSTQPVSMYQFNPLHYAAAQENFSFTNDASLLVPVQAGGSEYMVIARPTFALQLAYYDNYIQGWPGFIAIVGTAQGKSKVEVQSKAVTLASDLTSAAVYLPLSPGQKTTLEVEPYAVAQLLSGIPKGCEATAECNLRNKETEDPEDVLLVNCCETARQFDLTGTTVKVLDGPPPVVFAGTLQSYVPWNTPYSDHLEEQMFPVSTWGTRYVCGHTHTQTAQEPTVWRIVSGADGNEIAFTPASVHQAVTLDKGEFVEFESLADFEVNGTDKLAVAQFMVGQYYTEEPPEAGDPSMALVPPVAQYRQRYTFLAPGTYDANYVTVLHALGALPTLDGTPISGDTVEVSDEYARTNLEIEAGIHVIESDEAFGLTVYGVGAFTSYMYPGGLNLDSVVVVK